VRIIRNPLALAALSLLPSNAQAKPINSAMEFAVAILQNDTQKAEAMILGPVEQIKGAQFLDSEEVTAKDFLDAIAACHFSAVYDEMPSANIRPESKSFAMTWACHGRRVSVLLQPVEAKVRLTFLKASPMVVAPPAAARP
tara:strand:+ start:45 stop:467 length:423 start_codon:yes stop_codon:yes gene_type:complete